MRAIILLLIFLTSTCFSIPSNKDSKNCFRVMTYNIRYAGDKISDGTNAWDNRKEFVSKTIRFHKADIVGLQEALKIQLDDFNKLLPEYIQIGVGRDDGKEKGEFSAVLIRKDRFKILTQSTFWLSETPDQPSKGWDAAFPRIVTWAKLLDSQTKKIFFLFNTHFDHMGEAAKKSSATLILKKISEIAPGFPVVVTGDFNSLKDSDPYKILTESKGKDSKHELFDSQFISQNGHYGGYVSFNGFQDTLEVNNKIDYIFVNKKINVYQHGIIGEKIDGRYPSDHMPVVADLYIK
ncbi:MAG: endonuclease/exonuclease/phosphatase family protein [Ignavibacteriales bacterium]|nr:endonuclease/exonuclease/phosphatase family protein [Ignavibacteriales bacterium]